MDEAAERPLLDPRSLITGSLEDQLRPDLLKNILSSSILQRPRMFEPNLGDLGFPVPKVLYLAILIHLIVRLQVVFFLHLSLFIKILRGRFRGRNCFPS